MIHQRNSRDRQTDAPSADTVKQLSALIADKDQELKVRSLHVHKDVKFKRFFSVMPRDQLLTGFVHIFSFCHLQQ